MTKVEWKTMPLGEFAESVDYGVTASATEQPVGPKFLRITDIQDGAVNWESVPWCECDTRSASDARLKAGDIVFARTGATTGKSFLIRECPTDSVFASYLIRVRVGDAAEPRFVSHFFQTENYWAQVAKGARGVAQPGVNATTLKALQIPLPPLAEQRRIAEVLDRAEALRAKRRAALAQLDSLTQSLFLDLFGDTRKDSKHPQRVLDECAEVVSGIAKGRKLDGKQKVVVPYLRVANVQAGFLNLSEIKTIEALPSEVVELALKPGDVVLTEGGDHDKLGRGAMWEGQIERCIHQNHVFRVRTNQSKLLPRFFHEFLQAPAARAYFLRCAKRTTNLASINMTQLRALPVPLPPIELQREFARRVTAVEKLKTAQRASLAELDALFATLQHRAFRGEL